MRTKQRGVLSRQGREAGGPDRQLCCQQNRGGGDSGKGGGSTAPTSLSVRALQGVGTEEKAAGDPMRP